LESNDKRLDNLPLTLGDGFLSITYELVNSYTKKLQGSYKEAGKKLSRHQN